jgi:hypothetical protein
MDRNTKHFPTLLIICMLMSIILYVASNLVCFFHKRNKSLNVRASVTHGAAVSVEGFGEEEQQMTNFFKDQEDK